MLCVPSKRAHPAAFGNMWYYVVTYINITYLERSIRHSLANFAHTYVIGIAIKYIMAKLLTLD